MLVGDPTHWIARFRSLDVRFLECVLAVWPRCVAVLPVEPDEDTITINLVDILSRDAKARRLFHHLAYQHEPFGYTADGWAYSKGKIDMALLLDQERERYLAYECKRLNVVRNGRTRFAGDAVCAGRHDSFHHAAVCGRSPGRVHAGLCVGWKRYHRTNKGPSGSQLTQRRHWACRKADGRSACWRDRAVIQPPLPTFEWNGYRNPARTVAISGATADQ